MTEPTGLDYHAAYQACYPASVAQGIRIQDLGDRQLALVDRVARLRAVERQRVLTPFLAMAVRWEAKAGRGDAVDQCADEIRDAVREIR